MHTHTLPLSLTHSLTPSLTQGQFNTFSLSHIHSLTHTCMHSVSHTHSLIFSCTHPHHFWTCFVNCTIIYFLMSVFFFFFFFSCLITSDNLVCHDSTSMSIQTLVLLGGDTFIPTLLTVSNDLCVVVVVTYKIDITKEWFQNGSFRQKKKNSF